MEATIASSLPPLPYILRACRLAYVATNKQSSKPQLMQISHLCAARGLAQANQQPPPDCCGIPVLLNQHLRPCAVFFCSTAQQCKLAVVPDSNKKYRCKQVAVRIHQHPQSFKAALLAGLKLSPCFLAT